MNLQKEDGLLLVGKAVPLLDNNQFRDLILALVKNQQKTTRGHQVLQLYWAVVGNSHQCTTCFKYFGEKRLLKRHLRAEPSCVEDNFDWKYTYAKTQENLYFCYLGCCTFDTHKELECHLLADHEDSLL